MSSSILKTLDQTEKSSKIQFKSPAKVNLSLIVKDKLDTGYHELSSIMATIDLYDDLRIARASRQGIHLKCSGIHSPADQTNLVYKAANLICQYTEISPGIEITLHKRIPIGAGLGGGSSNAAFTLIGINQLFELGLTNQELMQLASQLGSDVPFFLKGPVALCEGRGEIVTQLSQRCTSSLLLVFPDIHCSTGDVYQNFKHDKQQTQQMTNKVTSCLDAGDLNQLVRLGLNNLETSCFELFNQLTQLKDQLKEFQPNPVCLSGSGSTLFIPYDDKDIAQSWATKIEHELHVKTKVVSFEKQIEPYREVLNANF